MSWYDYDEERETLFKRQRREEDTIMWGKVNLQQVIELLKKR